MSKKYSCDFNIKATIPPGLYEAFVAAQAKLLGIRGDMEKTADGFKGKLEADKETMEKIKSVMEKSEKFVSMIKSVAFTELKEIKEYTNENFNVKTK